MLTRRGALAGLGAATVAAGAQYPDIRTVAPDLATPKVTGGEPAPGRRVRETLALYRHTRVHHAIYLPAEWRPGRRYPVIAEYAGNGGYRNQYGDVSEGTVDGSNLGYGLSGGSGFIWVCLPYVNPVEGRNETVWWGDPEATADYAQRAIEHIAARYGGDPRSVILVGFSRGAIACNFIGLRNEAVARLWLAFLPYSHYDGVRPWGYPTSDRPAALERLRRLRGRAQFIIHENSVEETRQYLTATGVQAPFTFRTLEFRNHNDAWALRDIPERRQARAWLAAVLRDRPGG